MGKFVQVTSCDLRVDNKLFERWNYDIMIPLNLLFRTLLWKEILIDSIALRR